MLFIILMLNNSLKLCYIKIFDIKLLTPQFISLIIIFKCPQILPQIHIVTSSK